MLTKNGARAYGMRENAAAFAPGVKIRAFCAVSPAKLGLLGRRGRSPAPRWPGQGRWLVCFARFALWSRFLYNTALMMRCRLFFCPFLQLHGGWPDNFKLVVRLPLPPTTHGTRPTSVANALIWSSCTPAPFTNLIRATHVHVTRQHLSTMFFFTIF